MGTLRTQKHKKKMILSGPERKNKQCADILKTSVRALNNIGGRHKRQNEIKKIINRIILKYRIPRYLCALFQILNLELYCSKTSNG